MRQFGETGLVMLDLANTWDAYMDDPERLVDSDTLRRFCVELGDEPRVRDGDLVAVQAMRARLRAVLAGESEERARALACWTAELPIRAAVEDTNGVPRLRLRPVDDAGLADRLAIRAVSELLDLAAAGDWPRLRSCAAAPCRDVFVDRSRPGRRQFCSTRCANRAHAVASRARRRA